MAKQNETQVKFSVFNKEFNEGIKEMEKESTKLRKEFRLQSEQMKDTASATEKLEARVEYLGKEQSNVKNRIKSTSDQLKKAQEVYGENSNEANKLSNKLLDLRISEQKLGNAINRSKADIEQQSQSMTEARQDAQKYQQALDGIAEKANETGDSLSTGLSLPLAGIGTVAGMSAMDMDGALRLMTGSLGATGDEAKQLESDMRAVWEDGFGDNPEQVARSIALIKQNIKDINSGEDLQKITKNMLILANATEADMSEATRGVNQLMHNFGLTAQESMDLFTKGQQEGLNFSQEMFDNISEYAPLFKQMGFTAQEYFTILANGTENGAYNLDYINDLMKEFNIRVQDGSDTTADAFGQMSKETQSVFKAFEDGKATTEDLFNAVLPELEKMEDQVLANQIGVELFGSKFEDLEKTTVYSLDNVNNAFEDTEGAMDSFAKTQEDAFGVKFKKTMRELLRAIEPIGEELLDMADDVTPKIEEMAEWFVNLDDETKDFIATSGLLAVGLGPALKIFGSLTSLVGGFTKGLGSKGLSGTILRLVSRAGPIGLAVGALGGLGIAIGQAIEKKNELNEVSLETTNAMLKEHESTKKMIDEFDKLRESSKLTRDEFARYIDLQTELKTATDPGVITNIKDEMASLEEKSGFTNDELTDMIKLNSDLVKALPEASDEITTQGNKVAGTTDELRKYNQELAQMATVEIEKEFFEALENQNTLLQDRAAQQRQMNGYKQKEAEISQLLNDYSGRELDVLREQVEEELKSLQAKQAKVRAGTAEWQELQKQIDPLQKQYNLIKDGEQGLRNQLLTIKNQRTEQQIKIDNTTKEIAQLEQIYQRLQLNYLTSAGITEEKARQAVQDGTAIQAIDTKIAKLQKEKETLKEQTPINMRNTDEYRNAVGAIDNQIGKLNTTKGKIRGLASDARNYTDELSKDVTKNVNAILNPKASSLDDRLSETVWKTISLKYSNGNGHHVPVGYADGTNFHPGGPAIVGEEGPEIVKEGNKLSLRSFGIIPDLKRGARVFTAEQTSKMLSKLPGYAGGVGVSPELSRSLDNMSSMLTTTQNNTNRMNVDVGVGDVIIDGRSVGSIVWKPIKEFIDLDNNIKSEFQG
ncbi:phage tail tape measure protein [Radiobacillus kanasensis]|uniref:phage tail tape measure protein n=1 Tax=Radiobacillus kanasensis TaxID=2844358 RepID=UPI001E4F4A02|nr:phage tail tape measure protein [Radiobacillus kanasensis]UFU00372.1 phage tail tape measure protein [Radiobacillus kanasensis]